MNKHLLKKILIKFFILILIFYIISYIKFILKIIVKLNKNGKLINSNSLDTENLLISQQFYNY